MQIPAGGYGDQQVVALGQALAGLPGSVGESGLDHGRSRQVPVEEEPVGGLARVVAEALAAVHRRFEYADPPAEHIQIEVRVTGLEGVVGPADTGQSHGQGPLALGVLEEPAHPLPLEVAGDHG